MVGLRMVTCALSVLCTSRPALPPVSKVCVGATCPEDRLHLLLHLLEPSGGKLLAPVDNDLRLYTRTSDGSVRHRLVSSVRFSDLEVIRPTCSAFHAVQF